MKKKTHIKFFFINNILAFLDVLFQLYRSIYLKNRAIILFSSLFLQLHLYFFHNNNNVLYTHKI